MNLYFNIHGVSVVVDTKEKGFSGFLTHYLRGFESDRIPNPDCVIRVIFKSGYQWGFSVKETTPHTLGSGIGWDTERDVLALAQREVRAEISFKSPWTAEVSFQRNAFRHIANRLFFAGSKTQTNYYRAVTRLMLQNIVFMRLKKEQGVVPISAAAIKIGDSADVFVGLPGSGKSTLVQRAQKEAKAEIVAENFALTNGSMLFPFPEGNSADVTPCTVRNIYIISHDKELSLLPIAENVAQEAITTVNTLTAELPEQSPFGALPLINANQWSFISSIDNGVLKKLCATHRCHRLVVDPGADKAIQKILNA